MRRRTWKAAAASWKRSSRSESSSGSSCSTMPWSTSSIAIDALDRSTSLLAPPSRLGLRSRSFGGVPEGAQVFDRDLKRAHRDRAAWLRRQQEPKLKGDPLVREIASRLVDRLGDCSPLLSSRFRRVLLLGAEPAVLDFLAGAAAPELRSAVEEITVVDSSRGRLDLLEEERQRRDEERSAKAGGGGGGPPPSSSPPPLPPPRPPPRLRLVHADEETYAPAPSTFDVALSCGGLHWVNDLPGLLSRVRRSLAPGHGVFLAAVPGGDTLHELRRALARAEMDVAGGVSARVSPMIRMRDAGSLLGRAGFLVPGVDVDEIVVRYGSFDGAVAHLRALGESNAVRRRDSGPMRRAVAEAAGREFARICGAEAEAERAAGAGEEGAGRVFKSTFEIFFLTGWAPPPAGEEGPRAAARGSATVSFRELAEATRKHASAAAEEK